MIQSEHRFLFSSLDGKPANTARKVHIKRLYDVLQLCIQRNDLPRARRAFAILSRCREIEWKNLWKTGLLLLGNSEAGWRSNDPRRLEYLRIMMLQHPEERQAIIQELVLLLILSDRDRDALDELELYLPSSPYNDNPVLHTYAGMICLHLAQPRPPTVNDGTRAFSPNLLRDAQGHFERAKFLDPEAVVAQAFLDKIPELSVSPSGQSAVDVESDDEQMDVDDHGQRRKKPRTSGQSL
ncbi:hypothetical protein BV25DRAFT_1868628 [Artomyces pyxidatus]|uniref:Uncharacterized protein n=1 Tax=Artomyces pyxidatus TaxID=48021 RepID=A0ACB8TCI3_9AGAM|nr:hypothetical protein BV25DRAFT_1868628 [Artomyces pyxidatus]